MSDLQAQFEQAAADVKDLSKRPPDQTLLKLYAYFKQATEGDVRGSRPGRTKRGRHYSGITCCAGSARK